ncbi:MAG: ComEC/Rec2 family competence protein [Isosphaeraceae bacterium]
MKAARILRLLVLLGLLVSGAPRLGAGEPFSKWFSSGSKPVAVDFLDIGQGDSVLISSPEGKTALIDAGPTRDAAAQLLRSKGVTSLDIVIVSHHHSDHYGGMNQVIREFKPKYFMATGSSHTTKSYLKLLETVKAEGIVAVQPTGKPRKIELGSVVLTILPQPPLSGQEENNNSIGVRLQYGKFSVLMTGDSETDERRWWLSKCPELLRDCTVLKLAHHGSHNGTDQRWLDIVQPEIAVASLGQGNSYGHPHSETISLLRGNDIPLLRTDQRGTITIVSNGRTWNLVSPGLARRQRSRGGDAVASSGDRSPASGRSSRSRTSRK